jgi:hypothetical protein
MKDLKRKITRDNTVDEFLKERGAVEVTQKARDFFVERFTAVAETLAEKALAAARADAPARLKVDVAHLVKAFEGLGWSTTAGDLDPSDILARLHQMPPEQIGALVRLVREWLATQSR